MCLLMSLTSSVLATLSVFFFYLKYYLYLLLLLSSLSRNCRYNQLCKYAVVSNLPPRFVFWFSLFVRQVESSTPVFFVLNSKHLNGFWRQGSVRGRGNKEAFSWDAFTSKFLLERETLSFMLTATLFGIKGKAWNPLNVSSKCIKAHSERHLCRYLPLSSSASKQNSRKCSSHWSRRLSTFSSFIVSSQRSTSKRTRDQNWNSDQCSQNSNIF